MGCHRETPQGTIKEPPEVLGAQREGTEEITGDTTEVQSGSTAGRLYLIGARETIL